MKHSELPCRSSTCAGCSGAVRNSHVLGIVVSPANFHKDCTGAHCQAPEGTKEASAALTNLAWGLPPTLCPLLQDPEAHAGSPGLSYEVVLPVLRPASGPVSWLDAL